jgi:hypothetical protein
MEFQFAGYLSDSITRPLDLLGKLTTEQKPANFLRPEISKNRLSWNIYASDFPTPLREHHRA